MAANLTEWLTTILQEDERAAGALPADGLQAVGGIIPELRFGSGDDQTFWPARWNPVEVLRDIEAKRQILALHGAEYDDIRHMILGPFCQVCRYDDGLNKDPYPCTTLRLLALPYVARPGYREEWKP